MTAKCLSQNSCNQEEFNKATPIYTEALRKSRHISILQYEETNPCRTTKNRKRNVIWFNPPYNSNLKTNLGKEFFKLLKKHFPRNHPLHKICNQNKLKLSYSHTPNIASIISAHNKKLLQDKPSPNPT